MRYEWALSVYANDYAKLHSSSDNNRAMCNEKIVLDDWNMERPYLSFENCSLCIKCLKMFIKADREITDAINEEKRRLGETDFAEYEEITKIYGNVVHHAMDSNRGCC